MTTKTTSIRLDADLLDEIAEACEKDECNRNTWIKLAIENQLEIEAAEDLEEAKPTVDEHADKKPYIDSLGNRCYWNYNKERWVCQINSKNIRIVTD